MNTDNIEELLNNLSNLQICETSLKLSQNTNIQKSFNEMTINLANIFGETTKEDIHTEVTKKILILNKHTKLDIKLFIKSCTKCIQKIGTIFYENAIIITASLLEDSSFDFSNFEQLSKFKNLIPEKCFIKKQSVNLKDKFSDKTKIINDLSFFKKQKSICYLQEAIQNLKEEVSINEVFENLVFLIKKSSNRLIKNKCKEYFEVIMFYDGFDKLKCDALVCILERSFDLIINQIMEYVFSTQTSLRIKINLINVFCLIVEQDLNGTKTKIISDAICDKLCKLDTEMMDCLMKYNLEFLLSQCCVKLQHFYKYFIIK